MDLVKLRNQAENNVDSIFARWRILSLPGWLMIQVVNNCSTVFLAITICLARILILTVFFSLVSQFTKSEAWSLLAMASLHSSSRQRFSMSFFKSIWPLSTQYNQVAAHSDYCNEYHHSKYKTVRSAVQSIGSWAIFVLGNICSRQLVVGTEFEISS